MQPEIFLRRLKLQSTGMKGNLSVKLINQVLIIIKHAIKQAESVLTDVKAVV